MMKQLLFLMPVSIFASTALQVSVGAVDMRVDSSLQYGIGLSEVITVEDAPITGVELNVAAKYTTTATEYADNNSNDWVQISVASPVLMPLSYRTFFLVGPSLAINKAPEQTKFDVGTRFGIRHEFEKRGVSLHYDMCRDSGAIGLSVFA